MASSRSMRVLLLCAAATLSCKKPGPPSFTPSEFTANPAAIGPDEPAKILGRTAPGFVMARENPADKVSLLFGNAALSLSPSGELLVNLRTMGSSFRSACDFWFSAPIRHSTWKVSTKDKFVLRLDRGQYTVVENCGSPFDGRDALLLVFESRQAGEEFMNVIAALETRPASPEAAPSPGAEPAATPEATVPEAVEVPDASRDNEEDE